MDKVSKVITGFIVMIYVLPFILVFSSFLWEGDYDDEESTGFNDYVRITDVEYIAEVIDDENNGGKALITETITYDIHAADKDNLYWELYRDLVEEEVDGLNVNYNVLSVKEIKPDGTEIVFDKSPKLYWEDEDYTDISLGPNKWYHSVGPYNEYLRRYEALMMYIPGTYREKKVFEIQYVANNVALRYSDASELYLPMYSDESVYHLNSFKADIKIADKDMPKEGNYRAVTYGTNDYSFPFTESKTKYNGYHTFSFDLDNSDLKFNDDTCYIEFQLLSFNEDNHIFTDYAPRNTYSHTPYYTEAIAEIEEYEEYAKDIIQTRKTVFIVSIIVSAIILIYLVKKDSNIKNKFTFYSSSLNINYFRDIPSDLDPYVAGKFVKLKSGKDYDEGDGYSALMLSLMRKGYIKIDKIDPTKDWKQNNIIINILYVPAPEFPVNVFNSPVTPPVDTYRAFYSPLEQNVVVNENVNEVLINKKVNVNGKELEDLTRNENLYFKLICRHARDNSVTLTSFQSAVSRDYTSTEAFVDALDKSIINEGIDQGYFQKSAYNYISDQLNGTGNAFIVFAIIICIFGNLILMDMYLGNCYYGLYILTAVMLFAGFYLKCVKNKYILLTQKGEDEYTKWKALYNFLNSETLMKEREVIELALWEKYLVYATAFGISEKVGKALEIRCPEYVNSEMLNTKYYRSSHFRSNSRSFRSTTRSASSTSRSIRSGGYGSGGRGGGGGGGGH